MQPPDAHPQPTSDDTVRAAHAAYMREWRKANPELYKSAKKRADAKYHAANRDALLARKRQKYAANAEARKAQVRAYAAANPEKIKAYRTANRDKRNAQTKAWHDAHPEHEQAYQRAYYEANGDAQRAYAREYHQANRDLRLAQLEAWRQANPDKVAQQWARKAIRRRSRLDLAFVETIEPDVVYVRDYGICGICHQPVERRRMTIDHIVPLARGGEHSFANVQLAHRRCNSRKGARTMEEYLAAQAA